MADFVNYNKRSVTLPPGCKNLIDVLRSRPDKQFQKFAERLKRARVTHDESVMGKVSDVPKYVGMVFASRGLVCVLEIGLPGKGLIVDVHKTAGERPCASATFPASSEYERAFRDFVIRRGLRPLDDTPSPASFYPDIPVQTIYDISPSASQQPSDLAALIADVFRDACKLEDDSPIHIHYDEMSDS